MDRITWDFNGTLIDDVDVGIESVNVLLEKYNLPKINTRARYYEVFGFPIIDYYRRLGFDFDKNDYTVLANEWVALYLERVKKAPMRKGVLETVTEIKKLGIKQTVMSMTEQSMLEQQMRSLGISELFDEICGLDDIYAESKLKLAEVWALRHPGENVLYIGDTSHDVESAKIIGAKCLILAGGHEGTESLKRLNEKIIYSPRDVLKYIFKAD